MSAQWNKLQIDRLELDELLELDVLSTWAITMVRVFMLRQKAYYLSFLLTEASFLFLILLLLFPLNLIVFRNLELLENNTSGFLLVLLSTIVLSTAINRSGRNRFERASRNQKNADFA